MNILWCLAIVSVVSADTLFGSSYLKNSALCKPWTCISTKLNLPDTLPPKDQLSDLLKSLLPQGEWQEVVPKVLDVCYEDRPRSYTPTCPGQSLLHCVYDQLIQNCPEKNWVKEDACAPISCLAGFKYMFSQSRYENLQQYLPTERRPPWFLKNYFSSKCCNVPDLFNATVLEECGFNTIIRYYPHQPHTSRDRPFTTFHFIPIQKPSSIDYKVKVADIASYAQTTKAPEKSTEVESAEEIKTPVDPLDCCDVSELIESNWRSECDFHLSWDAENRLAIKNQTIATTTEQPSTTTANPRFDVKVVPLACEQETCIFEKLKVIDQSGKVDNDAFLTLLNNMTNKHPEWNKAKARVITNCLTNPVFDSSNPCEINRLLECTFDVLSENCPTSKKNDPCKRKKYPQGDSVCQINSSKYRPKNRRLFCGLPSLVNHEVLSQCEVNSLSRFEYIPEPLTPKPNRLYHWWSQRAVCKELTTSTTCLLNKMGVMSKYDFMDYFKMKDRLRRVTEQYPWNSLRDVYISTFTASALYRDYCSSPKKLLNVLDAMIMTCPVSKRKSTEQCNKFFKEIANTPIRPEQIPDEKSKVKPIHFQHVYSQVTATTRAPIPKSGKRVTLPTAMPPVETIDLKPQVVNKKPLVILPVYLRQNGKGSLSVLPYRDSVLRSHHFALPNEHINDKISSDDIRK